MAECPDADQHTKAPEGLSYLGWFKWADKMGKTHKQIRCPGCRLYKIWVPKDRDDRGQHR